MKVNPMPTIKFSFSYPWKSVKMGNTTVYYAGIIDQLSDFAEITQAGMSERLTALLLKQKHPFSVIVHAPNYIFASVDRLRSYPIYYSDGFVSNCSELIKEQSTSKKLNEQGLLEFALSGYVYGKDTLYEGLYQLQAGESLLWQNGKYETHRYYRYVPRPKYDLNRKECVNQHAEIIDTVMKRVVNTAAGDPIWVPLSGGLDSRLVLAKLVELQYPNVKAFSFGRPGNQEAKIAKRVAKTLGVPWLFIPPEKSHLASEHYRADRQAYSRRAHDSCVVPSYLGFDAFHRLVTEKMIEPNAIVVNGQSGDYLVGGHIPVSLFENPSKENLLASLCDKHCSLWLHLKTEENLEKITAKIVSQFPAVSEEQTVRDQLCSQYESWEWQERQCKMVVGGHQMFDYFKLRWMMPLWDPDLMDFWESMPFDWKLKQDLYLEYLKNYNFCDVFSINRARNHPWRFRHQWVVLMAKIIEIISDKKIKKKFYRYMYYYGNDHHHYAAFGRKFYKKHYKDARSVVSFFVKQFLNDMGINLV